MMFGQDLVTPSETFAEEVDKLLQVEDTEEDLLQIDFNFNSEEEINMEQPYNQVPTVGECFMGKLDLFDKFKMYSEWDPTTLALYMRVAIKEKVYKAYMR